MPQITRTSTATITLNEAELHEAVQRTVLRDKVMHGLRGKWKIAGTMLSKDPDNGSALFSVDLEREDDN